ncbi:hypothetical protein GOP47_0026427 [Adiantum capillus-veneris]|nr:hypothetical protein GOP47_0026427 [Adiantum capillus-veneris]
MPHEFSYYSWMLRLISKAIVSIPSLSIHYNKIRGPLQMLATIFARLCGHATQEKVNALQEQVQQRRRENEELATKKNELNTKLQEAEGALQKCNQTMALTRAAVRHTIVMLQVKGDKLLEQFNADAKAITDLFDKLRSDYKRLHEKDLETLSQQKLGEKSMKLS